MSRNEIPRLHQSYSDAMKAEDAELRKMMRELKEQGVTTGQLLDIIDMTIESGDVATSIRDFYDDNYRSE